MKKRILNCAALFGVLIFCVLLSVWLIFAEKNALNDAPVRQKDISGVAVNAISVADIDGVMKVSASAANYLADDFAELNETVSNENAGEYSGDAPARRGTYRFCIGTLQGEEWKDSESLQHLLKPDEKWHLTMYIPPVFSACSIYVGYQNEDYIGEIERYNIEYYTGYSAPSEFDDTVSHRTETKPIFIDIPISANPKFSQDCNVTIHYEADGENFVGFGGKILIGDDAAVRRIAEENRSLLLIGASVGAATFLIFVFICILKYSVSFVPQLLFAAGVSGALITTYLRFGEASSPYLLLALRNGCIGLLIFSAALYLPKKAGKIPVAAPVCAIAFGSCAAAAFSPFAKTASVYSALCGAYAALSMICIATTIGFTAAETARGKTIGLKLCFRFNCVIAGVTAISATHADGLSAYTRFAPAYWMCILMLCITLVLGFHEFISAEIHNRYLTENLEREVARETKNLQAVLAERDKILLYVSHDMKKTVTGMGNSLSDLRQNVRDPEQAAKVDVLIQKNAELKQDFAELGKYGKRNYVAEQSEILDLPGMLRNIADELRPDCEANGIAFSAVLPDKIEVYAKRIALESVITNLVLNAIEHAECRHLTVSATKRRGVCILSIIDDGKGISTDKDIFDPFVSGDNAGAASGNNSGLGLFLARSAMESMHGTLTYERKDNLTVFSATLPLA